LRDADTTVRRVAQRARTAPPAVQRLLQRARRTLDTIRPLARRVLAQTRQRIVGGDTHAPHKVLSVFEPHTEAIRKGKLVKPTEFGNLVTVQEAEAQIITAYEIHAERPADVTLWEPALDRHVKIFGRVPDLAAGDRGFASAHNEAVTYARGVRHVVLPRRGPKSEQRRAYERQRWFRRGARWRVGCEGRISVIKRRHGLQRCLYHGTDGMHRWVGLGIIGDNLLTIARTTGRRQPGA
jgi:IS5 family transposase